MPSGPKAPLRVKCISRCRCACSWSDSVPTVSATVMQPCSPSYRSRFNGRSVAFSALVRPTDRHAARRKRIAPHREVQAEHDVLVVERDAQRLLDPAQPQVQRLALQMQRPRGLGLAPARRQVGLERLQQRARARRRVAQQRAELLLDERVELGRVAQVVQEVGDARAARVVPARGGHRRRRARRAAHAPQAPARPRPTSRPARRSPAPRPPGRARAGPARRGRGARRARPARRRSRARRARAGSAGPRRAGRAGRRSRSRTARRAGRPTAAST